MGQPRRYCRSNLAPRRRCNGGNASDGSPWLTAGQIGTESAMHTWLSPNSIRAWAPTVLSNPNPTVGDTPVWHKAGPGHPSLSVRHISSSAACRLVQSPTQSVFHDVEIIESHSTDLSTDLTYYRDVLSLVGDDLDRLRAVANCHLVHLTSSHLLLLADILCNKLDFWWSKVTGSRSLNISKFSIHFSFATH